MLRTLSTAAALIFITAYFLWFCVLEAVVVASHGRDELRVLRAALDADVAYIALVASRRRAAGVLGELSATEVERARIHAPAGLDIGARSAAEIALSVCAGIVAARPRVARVADTPVAPGPVVAVDPICGMEVLVEEEGALQAGDVYFCGPGCLAAWQARITR